MSFKWADYVDFAREIFNEVEGSSTYEEARFRTVVSRSYYGVFKTAWKAHEEKINSMMKPLPGESVHSWLINRYFNSKNSLCLSGLCKRIAGELEKMREYRAQADYHDELKLDAKRLAGKALKHAEKALKLIDAL